MDPTAGASSEENAHVPPPPVRPQRGGFKHIVTREEWYGTYSGHSERSPQVNDGDTARAHVGIHYRNIFCLHNNCMST
jgi:hypothetical protein